MSSDLQRELQEAVGDVYAIERELARGGMSRVFVAVERSLGRRVVIKVLAPELFNGVSAARFQREVQVTANLQHPHILPVLAVGISGSLHYYVTPFIEGESLRARLEHGMLPVEDAIEILQDLADALAFAHERGIIHRDVKPGNVLLSGGHPILADFGIAGAVRPAAGERLTGTGMGIGTPGYMAPEQLAGDSTLDARADVFALGVLGYEMLSGRAPFDAPDAGSIAVAYFSEPRALSEIRPEVPLEVSNAIATAMARNPADRFESAAEFSNALRPVTSSYRARKRPARRARYVVAALGLLVLAGGGALARDRLPGRRGPQDDAAKVIAVLPFKNLGPPEDAYFADGVTEELTSRLASIGGLSVISRTSADQYRDSRKPLRQIAEELGVNYVLEGSVRWERTPNGRGRVRVTPQLIRVRDDSHLWTDRYDEELSGVFDVQARIAEQVAHQLAIALVGAELHHMGTRPTDNLAAWDNYLRAKQLLRRGAGDAVDAGRAIDLLTEATTADPRFAAAFAALAFGHLTQYEHYYDRTEARLKRATVAAESAFALDPSLPEAHLALGRLHESRGDFERAAAAYSLAERARPNDTEILSASAYLMMRRGEWGEGVKRFKRTADLNPRSAEANFRTAEALGLSHDYRAAATYLKRGLAVDADFVPGHALMALIDLLRTGDRVQAREATRAIILRFGAEKFASTAFEPLIGTLDSTDRATLERVGVGAFGGNGVAYYYWRMAFLDFWDMKAAAAAADSLVWAARTLVAERPDDPGVEAVRAWIHVIKGHADSAALSARRALELAPMTDDAAAWSNAAHRAAGVFVRIGEYETAIDQLERLLVAPSWISVPALRTDPLWAPLRGHPRFQRLLGRA